MLATSYFKRVKQIFPGFVVDFFSIGDRRTLDYKKNVVGAFFLKGFDTFLGFVRVPIIISYLSVQEYGIWLTLSSVIGWFSFFDIGLGSGLKTKLADCLGKKDYVLAKTYISTTYAAVIMIISSIFLIFLVVFPFLNWARILNVSYELTSGISSFVLIFVSLFAIQFVVNIIGTILTADQKPSLSSLIGSISGFTYMLMLILLKLFTKGSLVTLTLICNGTSVVVYTLASLYLFKKKYSHIKPEIKYVDFSHFRDLITLGIKFFFIQISSIILFSTDNMIITQLYTPAEVAPYNVSMKYMTIPLMAFSMITWPLWAAFSEAYAVKDIEWIKKTVAKLIKIWLGIIPVTAICLAFSGIIYQWWLHGEITVPFILSLFMGIYCLLLAWNQIFVFFLNGTGKIKMQLYMAFITIIINIPLSIYFARDLKIGPAGVMLATIVCILIGSIWAPIQYHKIINGKAKGIWDA